jgi:hypothetical protein
MILEAWKPVVGHETTYEVSSLGRVRRIATGPGTYPGRLLKLSVDGHGRPRVVLCFCNKQTRRFVSHLVADAFLPAKSPTDTVVRHLNDDPLDNRACNLARGTHSDNTQDAIRNGKLPTGVDGPGSKLNDDKVREIRRLYDTGDFTQQEIGLRFGTSDVMVSKIVRRKRWKHVV